MELEDAIHTAILALKESFEGQMDADSLELGVVSNGKFHRLSSVEIRDYLANI